MRDPLRDADCGRTGPDRAARAPVAPARLPAGPATWILLLGIALVCASSALARSSPQQAPIEQALDAFIQAFDRLERAAGDAASAEVPAVVAAAGALLTRRGIVWFPAADDADVIVVAPMRSAAKLNALAYRLKRHVGGLSMRFDPRALKEENAGALYYDDTHHLLLSAQDVATGEVTDYLAHEILHAQNFHALSRGIDNLFMGWISAAERAPAFDPSYGHRFSIDELQAYAQQARANLRELDRSGGGDVEGTLDMLDSGFRLATAAAVVSRQAAAAIAAVLASGSRRPIDEIRTIDERAVRVVGYRTRAARVYFYRWWLPERIATPPPVMRAVVESGDMTLDLMLPRAFTPALTETSLAAFLTRTRALAERSSRLAERFSELRALVGDHRFPEAMQRSNGLRALIRREH